MRIRAVDPEYRTLLELRMAVARYMSCHLLTSGQDRLCIARLPGLRQSSNVRDGTIRISDRCVPRLPDVRERCARRLRADIRAADGMCELRQPATPEGRDREGLLEEPVFPV